MDLENLLSDPKNQQRFDQAVKSALMKILGLSQDFSINGLALAIHNLDSTALAVMTCSIKSLQYAQQHMRSVPRFAGREELLDFALRQISLDGLILEFGVWGGYSINRIAAKLASKTVYGFDSFEGLPEDWKSSPKDAFALSGPPEVRENVILVQGWFDETLRPFISSSTENAAFIHVDCDLYSFDAYCA